MLTYKIDDSINAPNIRKPLTGRLHLKISGVKDVDHAGTSRFARGPETFVVVKVEDVARARTKSTRNDKWAEESHDIDVDKANEIEITVYDKPGDHPLPIGMLWIRISDIVEELRRKKIELDISSTGWVSADNMGNTSPGRGGNDSFNQGAPLQSPGRQSVGAPANYGAKPPGQASEEPKPMVIDSWFILEPVGQIHLQIGFGKLIYLVLLYVFCEKQRFSRKPNSP